MIITDSIKYIGVNDHSVDLFEGQYVVPNGMSYNSYAIIDEKIAIMDTVDAGFTHEWLDNIQSALGERKPDYLVVQHMEPDHSANIVSFTKVYADKEPEVARKYNIKGAPVLVIDNGDGFDKIENVSNIRKFVESNK